MCRLDNYIQRQKENRILLWRVNCHDQDGIGSSILTEDEIEAINFAVDGIKKRLSVSVQPETKYKDLMGKPNHTNIREDQK